jgi:hypothetical protein
MKSRRRIAFPQAQGPANLGFQLGPSEQEKATSEMGFQGQLRCEKLELLMTATGLGRVKTRSRT